METKRCSKCGKVKPVSEFYGNEAKNYRTKDKLDCYCKKCRKETSKKWNEKNREHYLKYQRKWYEENKNIIKKSNRYVKRGI